MSKRNNRCDIKSLKWSACGSCHKGEIFEKISEERARQLVERDFHKWVTIVNNRTWNENRQVLVDLWDDGAILQNMLQDLTCSSTPNPVTLTPLVGGEQIIGFYIVFWDAMLAKYPNFKLEIDVTLIQVTNWTARANVIFKFFDPVKGPIATSWSHEVMSLDSCKGTTLLLQGSDLVHLTLNIFK